MSVLHILQFIFHLIISWYFSISLFVDLCFLCIMGINFLLSFVISIIHDIFLQNKFLICMKSRVLPLFSLAGFSLLKHGFLIPRIIQIFEENIVSLNAKNIYQWEFSGAPVVRIQCFHCHGLGSIPGRGTEILHAARGVFIYW